MIFLLGIAGLMSACNNEGRNEEVLDSLKERKDTLMELVDSSFESKIDSLKEKKDELEEKFDSTLDAKKDSIKKATRQ